MHDNSSILSIFTIAGTLAFGIIRALSSITLVHVKNELQWSSDTEGWFVSALMYGNFISLLPVGVLVRRYRPQNMLAVAVLGYSFCTLCMPWAIYYSENTLIIVRALMGVFMAIHFPAQYQLMPSIIPRTSTSSYFAYNAIAGQLGTVIPLLASSYIIPALGWQSCWYLAGIIGLLWVLSWSIVLLRYPPPIRSTSEPATTTTTKSTNYYTLLLSPGCAAQHIINASYAYAYSVLMAWLPSFFTIKAGVHAGIYSAIPYCVQMVMQMVSGIIGDIASRSSMNKLSLRRYFTIFGISGYCFVMMVMSMYAADLSPLSISMLISAAFSFAAFLVPGVDSNVVEIAPDDTGLLTSASSFVSSFICMIFVPRVSMLLEDNKNDVYAGWSSIFLRLAAVVAGGGSAYVMMVTTDRLL